MTSLRYSAAEEPPEQVMNSPQSKDLSSQRTNKNPFVTPDQIEFDLKEDTND